MTDLFENYESPWLDEELRMLQDAGELDASTASMAKHLCTQKQNEIIGECLQLHGGAGFMNECPISHMYRDARVQTIYGGTNEITKDLISRTLDS